MRTYKRKEMGAVWLRKAKTTSFRKGCDLVDEKPVVNLPQINEVLYSRFCSLAKDAYFRGGVYGNAGANYRHSW